MTIVVGPGGENGEGGNGGPGNEGGDGDAGLECDVLDFAAMTCAAP